MNKKVLIVGAGLAGSVCAHELHAQGADVTVIDKKPHIGGLCFIENDGTHRYGPHIFHTKDKKIWNYVKRFVTLVPYQHEVVSSVAGREYPFPINATTLKAFFGSRRIPDRLFTQESNFDEVGYSRIGVSLYEAFYKGYTEKQWGMDARELPPSVFARVPIRKGSGRSYYKKGERVAMGNWNDLFAHLLDGVEVLLNVDFSHYSGHYDILVYSGMVDALVRGSGGYLPFRSLRWEKVKVDTTQGRAVVNYPDKNVPYTRSMEYGYFYGKGFIGERVYEYPSAEGEPFYPLPTKEARMKYEILTRQIPENVFLAGRLGEYRYLNMDDAVRSALDTVDNILRKYC